MMTWKPLCTVFQLVRGKTNTNRHLFLRAFSHTSSWLHDFASSSGWFNELFLVRCDSLDVITFIDFRFLTVTEEDNLNTTSKFTGNSASRT